MIDSKNFINIRHKNQKINYDNLLKRLIIEWENKKIKPNILIHSCCAPCSTYVLEYLSKFANITIYFSNSNIHPKDEYIRRALVQKNFIYEFNVNTGNNIKFISEKYRPNVFVKKTKGLEKVQEGGERCNICYEMRLEETARKAEELGFDYFASALTISPQKNSIKINKIGYDIQERISIYYLPSDFKKNNGYKRSVEMCKEYNIYRQCFCGCIYAAIKQGINIKKIKKEAQEYNKKYKSYTSLFL